MSETTPTPEATDRAGECRAALLDADLLDINRRGHNTQVVRRLAEQFGADLVRTVAAEMGQEARRLSHIENVVTESL